MYLAGIQYTQITVFTYLEDERAIEEGDTGYDSRYMLRGYRWGWSGIPYYHSVNVISYQ